MGVLLVVAFWPILVSMYGSWFDEHAYMEHGILVIPAAAYMAWTKKDKLKTVPRQPSAWGVFLLFWGALQAMFGLAAQWIWVGRMAFLVSLVGCIVAVYGWRMVRELVYPLCTLILMVTPPTFLFSSASLCHCSCWPAVWARLALKLSDIRCCGKATFWNWLGSSCRWRKPAAAFVR